MKIFTHAGASLSACLILAAALTSSAQAAELQVLAGAGIRGPLNEIAAQFEKVTGHKVVIRYGTAPELIKMATTGGPFDLGVCPADVFKDDATRAQFTSQVDARGCSDRHRHRRPSRRSQARHQHTRSPQADTTQVPIHCVDTGKRNGRLPCHGL